MKFEAAKTGSGIGFLHLTAVWHPSHRARSSVEIIITVITNKSKNKDNNNNEKIIKKGEEGGRKH